MREFKFRSYVSKYPSKFMVYSNKDLDMFFKDNKDNIMQCTGLADKYGKELYEGDICAIYNTKSELVGNGKIEFFNGTYLVGDIFRLEKIRHRVELLGNIFENKELMEVE